VSGQQRIEVTVHPDGSVTAETKDIAGAACLDYIAVLENLLEAATSSSAYTGDYYRTGTGLRAEAPSQTSRNNATTQGS